MQTLYFWWTSRIKPYLHFIVMIEIELFVKYILWARREQFGYDKQNWIIFMCVAEPKKNK